MQKKLMAVAVMSALGAPAVALAQTSTVQVFGTMYVEYSYIDRGNSAAAGNPSLPSVDMVQTPGSEIGFKGEEKLGGGLSAWFQCATTADPRGLSQNGWCSRNSGLGFKGGFGNVWIGNWDMPMKRAMGPTSVGSNETGIWGSSFLLTGGSTTTDLPPTGAAVARGTFKRRQNNTLFYDTPNFGGFSGMVAVSSTQNATGAAAGIANDKARIYGIAGQYSAGPLFISAGYEMHKNFNQTAPGAPGVVGTFRDGDDDGWGIGAAYTWGPVRFGGSYNRQKFESGTVAAPLDAKVSTWHLGVDWQIVGPHGLRASFTRAEDMKGSAGFGAVAGNGATRPAVPTAAAAAAFGSDNGADLWTIRYVYTFSKRTEFNFGYARLENDGNSGAAGTGGNYVIGGLASPGAHQAGDKQHAWGMSVRHTF